MKLCGYDFVKVGEFVGRYVEEITPVEGVIDHMLAIVACRDTEYEVIVYGTYTMSSVKISAVNGGDDEFVVPVGPAQVMIAAHQLADAYYVRNVEVKGNDSSITIQTWPFTLRVVKAETEDYMKAAKMALSLENDVDVQNVDLWSTKSLEKSIRERIKQAGGSIRRTDEMVVQLFGTVHVDLKKLYRVARAYKRSRVEEVYIRPTFGGNGILIWGSPGGSVRLRTVIMGVQNVPGSVRVQK